MDLTRRTFLISSGMMLYKAWNAESAAAKNAQKDIMLCFDCGEPKDKWSSTLDLAKELSDISSSQARFTYYIVSAFLFPKMPGSTVGAGGKPADIEKRKGLIQQAICDGHEIGSHTVRHQDGRDWSRQRWTDELSEFDSHVAHAFHDVSGKPYKARGFRAPYLLWNLSLYRALEDNGYTYDVSMAGAADLRIDGIYEKGVPFYECNGRKVLGMDYNWSLAKISSDNLERMLYKEAEKRDKLVISLHFTDFSGGKETYCETVSRFLKEKAREGSRFLTMEEYVKG